MYSQFVILFLGLIINNSASFPVTYGSAVKLMSLVDNSKFFLRSLDVQWNGRPQGQNIVTTVADESSSDVYWVVLPVGSGKVSGEVVECKSMVKLRHAVSGKNLQVDTNQPSTVSRQGEVTVNGGDGDNFILECGSGSVWDKGVKVYFKHVKTGGYLKSAPAWLYTQQNCPRCPIVGQREVGVSAGGYGYDAIWSVEGGVLVHEKVVESEEVSERDEL